MRSLKMNRVCVRFTRDQYEKYTKLQTAAGRWSWTGVVHAALAMMYEKYEEVIEHGEPLLSLVSGDQGPEQDSAVAEIVAPSSGTAKSKPPIKSKGVFSDTEHGRPIGREEKRKVLAKKIQDATPARKRKKA